MKKKIIFEKLKIIFKILNYNCIKIININDLLMFFIKKLKKYSKIKIKFGLDPTSKNIHVGHVFYLIKLINFKKLFKLINFYFIIGFLTSYFNEKKNYYKFLNNIKYILYNLKYFFNKNNKLKFYYNTEWFYLINLKEKLILLIFLKNRKFLNLKKFKLNSNYMLIQSFDSLFLKTDFEIGGLDQKTNFFFSYNYLAKNFNFKQFYFLYFLILKYNFKKVSKSHNDSIFNFKNLVNLIKNIKTKELLKNYYKIFLSINMYSYYFLCFNIKILKKIIIKIIIKKYFINFKKNNKIFFLKFIYLIKFHSIVLFKILRFLKIYNHFIIKKNLFFFINSIKIFNLNFVLIKNTYKIKYNNLEKYFILY